MTTHNPSLYYDAAHNKGPLQKTDYKKIQMKCGDEIRQAKLKLIIIKKYDFLLIKAEPLDQFQ